MHLYEIANYKNLIPDIKLTSAEIKEKVSLYRLSFSQERNEEVEWRIKLPMFVYAFYNYLIVAEDIPDQQKAFEYYLEYNKEYFSNLNRPDLISGIKARFYRTYPSLVRDVYFNKFIYERLNKFCEIIYNSDLDVEEGIDLMIVTKKANYGICFFTKTRRGYVGRKAKENRHVLFDNVKYIEMPMEFQGSVKAGDFFLYGEKEYNELYNLLSQG